MEFVLKLNLVALVFFLLSCGKEPPSQPKAFDVPDDWPGIDELSVSAPENFKLKKDKSFNLRSELLLPKMGKEIKYSLNVDCLRKKEKNTPVKAYTTQTHFAAGAETHLKPLPISNYLPKEMLIYPKHFESCSFQLQAQNPNGSSDSSKLENLSFELNANDYGLKLSPKNAGDTQHLRPFNPAILNTFSVTNTQGEHFKKTQILCFSNHLVVQDLEKDPKKSIASSEFSLFKSLKNTHGQILNNCVLTGFNLKDKLIVSKQFSLRPQNVHYYMDQNHAALTHTVHNQSSKQIPYNSPANQEFDLFGFNMTNTDSFKRTYQLGALSENIPLQIIHHFHTKHHPEKQLYTGQFAYYSKPILGAFKWETSKKIDVKTRTFTLEPNESIHFNLSFKPQFKCELKFYQPWLDNHSTFIRDLFDPSELGFIVAPSFGHALFQISLLNQNEYKKEAAFTRGLLSFLEIGEQIAPNLPHGIIPFQGTEFELLFKSTRHELFNDNFKRSAQSLKDSPREITLQRKSQSNNSFAIPDFLFPVFSNLHTLVAPTMNCHSQLDFQ